MRDDRRLSIRSSRLQDQLSRTIWIVLTAVSWMLTNATAKLSRLMVLILGSTLWGLETKIVIVLRTPSLYDVTRGTYSKHSTLAIEQVTHDFLECGM